MGKYTATGLPHVTKIHRKPDCIGAELKSLADGMSGVILSFDIMGGKERQSKKTLRLTQTTSVLVGVSVYLLQ